MAKDDPYDCPCSIPIQYPELIDGIFFGPFTKPPCEYCDGSGKLPVKIPHYHDLLIGLSGDPKYNFNHKDGWTESEDGKRIVQSIRENDPHDYYVISRKVYPPLIPTVETEAWDKYLAERKMNCESHSD